MPDSKTRDRDEASIAGAVILLFRRWKPSVSVGYFDESLFIQDFTTSVAPRFARVYDRALQQLSGAHEVDVGPESARLSLEWANKYAEQLAEDIAADMRERIGEVAHDDLHRAHILQDLAKEALTAARAKDIAITETTRGISMGEKAAVEAIKRDGIKLIARWYTEDDERVCPICEPLDGMRERIWRRRFPFGPPAHPRCRCWLEYDTA